MARARIACFAALLGLLVACDRSPPPGDAPPPASSPPVAPAPAPTPVPAPPSASAPPAAASAAPTPPGTDSLVVVKSPSAPLLPELGPGVNATMVLHAGDLVYVQGKRPPLGWHARMGGVEATRDGDVVEVQLAADDSLRYAFAVDLGEPVLVPSAAGICARLLASTPPDAGAWRDRCAVALRRARLGGDRVAAFVTCAIGACPVAIVKGDEVRAIRVDGISSAQLHGTGDRALLLLTTRWVKDQGRQSGGALAVVTLDGPAPKVVSTLRLDEIDARDAVRIEQRDVRVEVGDAEIRLVGERRTVVRDTAAVSAARPIDERHPLPRAR
jgi:hypothetical protein